MEARILAELATLKTGTTMCPGALALRLGTTLRDLRPTCLRLAESGRIRVTQRGQSADLRTLRGPFRIRLADVAPSAEG